MIAALMVGASVAANSYKPTQHLADLKPKIQLATKAQKPLPSTGLSFVTAHKASRSTTLAKLLTVIGSRKLRVQRLLAVLGRRREPITYWITMDETATLPGFSRKYEQMRYGLRGQIPDGLLFRVSSISSDDAESFKLQEQFLNELAASMAPSILTRYFGR